MRMLYLAATVPLMLTTTATGQQARRPLPSPARAAIAPAPAVATAGAFPLTVRYPTTPAAVELITSPVVGLSCAPGDGSSASAPDASRTVCRGQTQARQVSLRVMRKAPPEYPFLKGYVAGGQWGGACLGTRGTTCTLEMTEPREVTVRFDSDG
jgi:hypothetical protein